ncbi:MAG TPA: hypothetical protein VIP11_18365 [Gemmatimonadaceae bacterium]
MPLKRIAALCGLLVAFTPTLLRAQIPKPKLSLNGGVTHYDFGSESDGTTGIGAVRLEVPLVLFVAEGSVGIFRPEINDEKSTFIVPELQVQWQSTPIGIRPYVGLGVGWLHPTSGPGATEVTYSGSLGVRAGIPFFPLSVRAEARHRIRGSSFSRHATELTLGVSW